MPWSRSWPMVVCTTTLNLDLPKLSEGIELVNKGHGKEQGSKGTYRRPIPALCLRYSNSMSWHPPRHTQLHSAHLQ